MGAIETNTTILSMDEPCFYYAELAKQSENKSGFHRYACIWVIRNDKEFQADVDMGSIEGVDDQFFQIVPDFPNETVGEVMDIADQVRVKHLRKFLNFEPPELTNRFQGVMEEKQKHVRQFKKNQDVYGGDVGQYVRLQE